MNSISADNSLALARATLRAEIEISEAITFTSGSSSFAVIASHPEPVPISRMDVVRWTLEDSNSVMIDSDSGRGIRTSFET